MFNEGSTTGSVSSHLGVARRFRGSAPSRRLSSGAMISFPRLAVFAGGFYLHAVGRVCTDAAIDEPEAIDVVMSLVAKSLVILQEDEDVGRYRLLETIREYALEKLREAAEEAATREKHLDWCVDLAEQAEPEIHETADAAALDRLQADLDNCRAALGWSLGRQDAGSALRLASALLDLWTIRADWTEGRDWVERALALPGEVDPGLRAKGLRAAGSLADVLSDYAVAVGFYEE